MQYIPTKNLLEFLSRKNILHALLKLIFFFLGIYLNLPFANINPRKCRFKCFDLMKSKLEDYTVNANSARFNSSENTVAAN